MNASYITQPGTLLGKELSNMLDANPSASHITFVSAFVSFQTIMRVKHHVLEMKKKGVIFRFVIGIDLGGTSQEVLKELLGWDIDIRIVKHRIPGHTFHPKIYYFQWDNRATIIVGSNNITEGGFYGNYESAVCITYELPEDDEKYCSAYNALSRFLDPSGPVVYKLTADFLEQLISRGEIPTETEVRKIRRITASTKKIRDKKGMEPIFGVEDIESPPPLPGELLKRLIEDIRVRRKTSEKKLVKKKSGAVIPIDDKISDPIQPFAFYMTLPKLQGSRIPGEGRIPLEAIELAKKFWGWPNNYVKKVSPRAGKNRVYWNWYSKWKIWSAESPKDIKIKEVRMYMYMNSSDFRFYVRPLVNAGGNLGDVVRIRRIAEPNAEFECVLARQGTPEYYRWINYCTQNVRNSTRKFGYA